MGSIPVAEDFIPSIEDFVLGTEVFIPATRGLQGLPRSSTENDVSHTESFVPFLWYVFFFLEICARTDFVHFREFCVFMT